MINATAYEFWNSDRMQTDTKAIGQHLLITQSHVDRKMTDISPHGRNGKKKKPTEVSFMNPLTYKKRKT